jgi:hypothetical protein
LELVDQNSGSWSQSMGWLRNIDAVRLDSSEHRVATPMTVAIPRHQPTLGNHKLALTGRDRMHEGVVDA